MSNEHDSEDDTHGINRRTALKGGAAGLGILGLNALGASSAAAANGADKVGVTGSTMEIMEVAPTDASNKSSVHTLLSGTMKTSSPTDLIIQPTLETSLLTDLVTETNDSSEATASITGWVEIDGEPVIVASDYPDTMTQQDAAEVVFDRREHKMTLSNFDDDDATMREFLRTRSTNGFNWVDLNLGSGTHNIDLKARLDVYADESSSAKALIGPRTLVVEPVKLSPDATI